MQSQWERVIFDPDDIKILKIFKFELDVHDYVHDIYSSANFHFNPLSWGLPDVGEILRLTIRGTELTYPAVLNQLLRILLTPVNLGDKNCFF